MIKNVGSRVQPVGWDGVTVELKPGGLLDVRKAFNCVPNQVRILEDKLVSNHRGVLEIVQESAEKAEENSSKPKENKDGK